VDGLAISVLGQLVSLLGPTRAARLTLLGGRHELAVLFGFPVIGQRFSGNSSVTVPVLRPAASSFDLMTMKGLKRSYPIGCHFIGQSDNKETAVYE
jgi:hypothetical protein